MSTWPDHERIPQNLKIDGCSQVEDIFKNLDSSNIVMNSFASIHGKCLVRTAGESTSWLHYS